MSKTDTLLEVSNISIEFFKEGRWKSVVNDVNFSLNKGETIGIVGESGSGKTVSAFAILQLLPPNISRISSGKILFSTGDNKSVDLSKLSEKEMLKWRGGKIGMIFQEPMTSLNPVHTCGQQVEEVLQIHSKLRGKELKNRCIELLSEVKLPRINEIYKTYPHQRSGGQRQRVMIAMAIACEPLLLSADEPTTALDVTVQKEILLLLNELRKKYQMSMLFISHDLGVVSSVCDRVAVMYKGSIVEEGPSKKIFLHPTHPYTKGLVACKPDIAHRPDKLPVISDFIHSSPNVSVLINKEATIEERVKRLEKLYSGERIMSVEEVNTWIPVKKNLLGKPQAFLKAVNGVSFDIFEGETLGLVGESGCGKTTLGRTILRLTPMHSGKIIYKGGDISILSAHEMRNLRKDIQIIFQDPYSSLNPRIRIGKAITEPMLVHGIGNSHRERKEKAMQLLERVGLERNHYDRYPHEFSGGQRQRICIARSLSVEPKLIICDESVSALDVSVQATVLNLLNELKREFNLTYLFISHDLSVVKFMADRIMVMKAGKIIEEQEADAMFLAPQTDYTRELLGSIRMISD